MDNKVAKQIIEILEDIYDDVPALLFENNFELLIAVMLSAQCTDKRVNIVTRELFKIANTPQDMLKLTLGELEEIIKTCGLYKSKAKNILSTCKKLISDFNGVVPREIDSLITLDGVGRKTANVVHSVGFHGDAIAVDTHVFRVSNRIGLANSNNVTTTEKQLNDILDKEVWSKSHHYLIYHGRSVCKAQNPKCSECLINNLCEKRGV